MDIRKVVVERRSIRGYSSKEVSLEDVGEILESARFSPSSGNMQSWKIIVVTDAGLRADIAKVCKKQDWMADAPVHLVICNEYPEVVGSYKKLGKMFSIQNCAVLATNIMNLAYASGLGTCWVGSFPADSIKGIIGLPEDGVDPEVIITLGYPAKDLVLEDKPRKDIFDIAFFDKWGNKEGNFKSGSFIEKLKDKFLKK